MKKSINKNDLVIIQKTTDNLEENDIIAINKENKTIISRIYQIEENSHVIITKGDNNLYPDNEILKKEDIEGKSVFKIAFIGVIIAFLQSEIMTVITVVLLCLKLIFNNELKRRATNAFKQKL